MDFPESLFTTRNPTHFLVRDLGYSTSFVLKVRGFWFFDGDLVVGRALNGRRAWLDCRRTPKTNTFKTKDGVPLLTHRPKKADFFGGMKGGNDSIKKIIFSSSQAVKQMI